MTKPVTAEHVHGETGLDTGSGVSLPEPISNCEKQHAVEFILETLSKHSSNEITLVATGPLTNLAAAYALDPKTFKKAKNIILMGGAGFEPGNITPAAEFNIFVDPLRNQSLKVKLKFLCLGWMCTSNDNYTKIQI